MQGNYPPGSLELLLARIKQQVGVCNDRAQAFMLLAHWVLGLEDDVLMISNETHAFCDVRDKDGRLHQVDFSGKAIDPRSGR